MKLQGKQITTPNIIYILADDMGYGDMFCNNPDSKIPTPNLVRLAEQGIRFTDAHAASSVCTPSRYSILTGRYCWRSPLKRSVLWSWDGPLIEANRPTVAGFLRDQGYHTACIGKWHLGWDWVTKDGRRMNDLVPVGVVGNNKERHFFQDHVDYTKPVGGGPVARGFDTYFGVDVPNFPPYTWFEDDRLAELPTEPMPDDLKGWRGLMKPGWKHEAMLPEFTRRAVALIEHRVGNPQPYFLYLALTSPHTPIAPNAAFRGKSGAGPYGDFVCETDWVVGEVMTALERTGTAENTLVIFTSDNGPEGPMGREDIGAYERIREHRHYSMGELRGIKRDTWEGGHRVPFIASWPGVIEPGSVCDRMTSLMDLFPTCADIVGQNLPEDAAPDAMTMLPLLKGEDSEVRPWTIHHSCSGTFAVRKGRWVFIDAPTGDDNKEPGWFRAERGYTAHDCPGELYNLEDDISERRNLFLQYPDVAKDLKGILEAAKANSGTDEIPPSGIGRAHESE